MSAYEDHEVPIIVRGEGCYVYDEHGKRYFDGLSALFCVNAGHGRAEIADAMADQAASSASSPTGATRTRRAIELAARIAVARPRRPQPRVLHLRRQRGGGVRARSCAEAYHRKRGDGQRYKLIAREIAYHGTTMGALVGHGHPRPARALRAARARAAATCPTPTPTAGPRSATRCGRRTRSRRRILFEGARDRVVRDPRARPERRRAASRPRTATSSACARSATATACC